MSENDGVFGDLFCEGEQFVAIGMSCEIELGQLAMASDFAHGVAEQERFAWLACFESAARRVRVGVTDEQNAVSFVMGEAQGEVMCGGVFVQHSGCYDKDVAALWLEGLYCFGVNYDEVECLVEEEVGVVPVCSMRFEVVYFREDTAQTADVNGLRSEPALLHPKSQQCQYLLSPTQCEGRDENAAFALEDALNCCEQSFFFGLATESFWHGVTSAGCFEDNDICLDIFEPCSLQQGLIAE